MKKWFVPSGLALLALGLAVAGAEDPRCSPVPVSCPCEEVDLPVCDEATQTTYANACEAECSGVGTTAEGACGYRCWVAEGEPVGVGETVLPFLCRDRNPNSASFAAAVSDITLAEQVWIAYFGACT